MVRIIYAVMALALGALVTGFFVNTSSTPLLASIVLSAAVMLLILFGWSRRIRSGIDLLDAGEPAAEPVTDLDVEDLEVVEVDEDEIRPTRKPQKRKPAALRRRDAERAATNVTESTAVLPKVQTKRAPKPKPATGKKKAAAQKAPAKKPAARPAARKAPAAKPKVLVIPGREKFHRRGCRFAKGDDLREVSEASARKRGYEPCNVCGS